MTTAAIHTGPTNVTRFLNYLREGGSRKLGYRISAGIVAAVTARVSYWHIRDVNLVARQPLDVAAVLPLAVDGMLLVASLAIAEDKANGRRPRTWARVGFWFGAVISLACNVASTIVHAPAHDPWLPLSIFVSALAPVLLLITVEIMARPGKVVADADGPAPVRRVKTDADRLEDARKRAGYYQMNPAQRKEWTRKRNERLGKRIPLSPAVPAVPTPDDPSSDRPALPRRAVRRTGQTGKPQQTQGVKAVFDTDQLSIIKAMAEAGIQEVGEIDAWYQDPADTAKTLSDLEQIRDIAGAEIARLTGQDTPA